MADDNQQEGMSAQERLARLYSSRVDDQQGDTVPTAGQATGARVSAGTPQAQASTACVRDAPACLFRAIRRQLLR